METTMSFAGEVAVVTGAASGIGRATALGYAARGGGVALVDRDPRGLDDLLGEIRVGPGEGMSIKADVSDETEVRAAIAAAHAHFGRIDFLMNNAYAPPPGFRPCLTEELETTHWRHTLRILLDGAFFAIRAVLPEMRKQRRGSIVNIASISGLAGDTGGIAYNTAKAGLLNLTRVVALEYAPFGLRCNAISPGVIDTPLITALDAVPAFKTALLCSVPMGRAGTPAEVADLALFLASDRASFITGAAYTVDGGQTAHTGMPSPLSLDHPA